MADLRAAVVGLGEMGRHHARALREVEGVVLVSVIDPRLAGQEFLGVPVLADVAVLDRGVVDMAVLATPTTDHEALALRLAEANIPTLVEKPLTTTYMSSLRVQSAFAARSLLGCVGHIERYNPALLALRQRLLAGQLGKVYQVVTRRQGPYPQSIRDVGVVMDLATHDLDIAAWVTGERYLSVSAQMSTRSGRSHEDMVAVVGALDAGAMVNHLVNWLSPLKERITVVIGEKGCFVADTLTGDLTFYENGLHRTEWESVAAFRGVVQGDVIRYALHKREPLIVELEAFRDAILGIRDDTVSMSGAMETVRVAEAVLKSCNCGGEIVRL